MQDMVQLLILPTPLLLDISTEEWTPKLIVDLSTSQWIIDLTTINDGDDEVIINIYFFGKFYKRFYVG